MTNGGQKRGATAPQTENGQAAAVDGATATDAPRLPDTSPATGHEAIRLLEWYVRSNLVDGGDEFGCWDDKVRELVGDD